MRALGAALLAVFVLAPPPAAAGQFTLTGEARQGGLMIGRAEAGARVEFNGKPIRVSPAGVFVIGFGRDAEARAVVRVRHADDTVESRDILVVKRDYDIQRIDGLPSRQVTPSAEDLKRIRAESAEIAKARGHDGRAVEFAAGFQAPAQGRVSGVYGSQRILNGKPRRPHLGLDIAAPAGAPVSAAAAGVVTLANPGMFFNGKIIIVDHGHGVTSVYMHLSEILVRVGARVAQGALIGRVGQTGRVTGPHLHWGLSLFDTYLDPALLPPR